MAVIQSCCWLSVRKGSYACGIYTMIYFALPTATITWYLWNQSTVTHCENFEAEGCTPLTALASVNFLEVAILIPKAMQGQRFIISMPIYSFFGVNCSFFLLYGLYKDNKRFLIPWIIFIACSIMIMCISLIDLISPSDLCGQIVPHSKAAMFYLFHSFIFCLNVCSLLCVISQYQEYSAGRGTAAHDYENRIPATRYQPTTTTTATTSCLSSQRHVTNGETKTTLQTQSPTTSSTTNPLLSEKSPTGSRASGKHMSSLQIHR